jgi:hypothetical protein
MANSKNAETIAERAASCVNAWLTRNRQEHPAENTDHFIGRCPQGIGMVGR